MPGLYKCDGVRAGFDKVAFLSRDTLGVVEDAGDTLHTQRNALDSGYALDVELDYSKAANQPVRWLAEGRDASATVDAANAGFGKNDQDNELTGIFVSDGDPSVHGVLGTKKPRLWHDGWRMFYTRAARRQPNLRGRAGAPNGESFRTPPAGPRAWGSAGACLPRAPALPHRCPGPSTSRRWSSGADKVGPVTRTLKGKVGHCIALRSTGCCLSRPAGVVSRQVP
jgi:hypothetical protein